MPIVVPSSTQVGDELGSSRWTWIPLVSSDVLDTLISISYAEVPNTLVPSSAFQVLSETTNCTLVAPWGGFEDPWNNFLLGGGTSGSIFGALSGLSNVEQSFIQPTVANYGLGQQYLGPEFGYCLGRHFKEKIYVNVFAENIVNLFVLASTDEDLIWRSRFERFYVNHGLISGFSPIEGETNKFTITIPTNTLTTSVDTINFSSLSDQITLYKQNEQISDIFSVVEVRGVNSSLEIDVDSSGGSDFTYTSSDYFTLSRSWLIQDPYLMDGLMSSIANETTPTGSEEFFRTKENATISNASVTGVYIRKRIVEDNQTEVIDMPSPNVDMESTDVYTWYFYPITSGSNTSEVYANNTRYVIERTLDTEGNFAYNEVEMPIATDQDYQDLISNIDLTYVKSEISNGGRSTRNNFHDDHLIDEFFIQDDKYYRIVGQEGGNVIDINAVDIKNSETKIDPKTNADYTIYNQYAWKTSEWYMSTDRGRFLGGTIQSITDNTITVLANANNTATTFGQSYFNNGVRDSISFYDRFTKEYNHDIDSAPRKLYTKYKGWYEFNSAGVSYPILNVDAPDNTDSPFEVTITLDTDGPLEGFAVGDTVYSLFDKEQYPRGLFNGLYLAEASDQPSATDATTVNICIDGYWLAPEFKIGLPTDTRLGLCGGRYFGIGDSAPDNENAVVFMRAPSGVVGLSAMYDDLMEEDVVLYYDLDNQKLSIRKASVSFQEYPERYNIAIGRPTSIGTNAVNGNVISFTGDGQISKAVIMDLPDGNNIVLFKTNNGNDYYGTVICGDGETKLLGLEVSDVDQTDLEFLSGDNPVSPIYLYKLGDYSRIRRNRLDISVESGDNLTVVDTNGDPVTIANVKTEYINDNQTIENASLFDILKISDGEMLIVIGRPFGDFTANGVANSGSEWESSNGVVIYGSRDHGKFWGAPYTKDFGSEGEEIDNQYGLLVMNGVDYCCSVYNELIEELAIFVRCYDNGAVYYGAYFISLEDLNYQRFACESESRQDFLYRPPAIDLSGDNKIFTETPVDADYAFSNDENNFSDQFVRIASANPNIGADIVLLDDIGDFGTVYSTILNDNTYVIFYDRDDGIHLIFSNASGRKWGKSEIIIARDGKAGFFIGSSLVYITNDGLVAKVVTTSMINDATTAIEGESEDSIETIQIEFDNAIIVSLGTGPLPTQQLTGYVDDQGIRRIFYYDDQKRLCSFSGTDLDWYPTDNF